MFVFDISFVIYSGISLHLQENQCNVKVCWLEMRFPGGKSPHSTCRLPFVFMCVNIPIVYIPRTDVVLSGVPQSFLNLTTTQATQLNNKFKHFADYLFLVSLFRIFFQFDCIQYKHNLYVRVNVTDQMQQCGNIEQTDHYTILCRFFLI